MPDNDLDEHLRLSIQQFFFLVRGCGKTAKALDHQLLGHLYKLGLQRLLLMRHRMCFLLGRSIPFFRFLLSVFSRLHVQTQMLYCVMCKFTPPENAVIKQNMPGLQEIKFYGPSNDLCLG